MDHKEQKILAKSIFEKLGFKVDLRGCYDYIIHQLTIDQCVQVLNLVEDKKVCSQWAFETAKIYPEQKNKVIDFVTESEFAYYWCYFFGDSEIMRDRITESMWAFEWAYIFGDREIMRDRVTESKWAFEWALKIGDREIMRDRVTDSKSICFWAKYIGDKNIMREKIINKDDVFNWLDIFKTDIKFFQQKFPEYFEETIPC